MEYLEASLNSLLALTLPADIGLNCVDFPVSRANSAEECENIVVIVNTDLKTVTFAESEASTGESGTFGSWFSDDLFLPSQSKSFEISGVEAEVNTEEDAFGSWFSDDLFTVPPAVAAKTPESAGATEFDEDFFGDLFYEDDGSFFGDLFGETAAASPDSVASINQNLVSAAKKAHKKKSKKAAQQKPKAPKPPKPARVYPSMETTHFCDSLSTATVEAFNRFSADPFNNNSTAAADNINSRVDAYRAKLTAVGEQFENEGVFGCQAGLREIHHYYTSGYQVESSQTNHTSKTVKLLMKELTNVLEPSLSLDPRGGSMFVRYDDENPQYMRAMLSGQENTPYESGLFMFDIFVPSDYPNVPPLVTHVTPGANTIHAPNGPGGLSPNMHSDSGKVCLSLLGTWGGLGWESGTSNLYQVLSSISLMILGAEHAYYMEPGHGGWEDTANIDKDLNRVVVLQYDDAIREHVARLCILQHLLTPPVGFEKIVRAHFQAKQKRILRTLHRWMGDFCSCDKCDRFHASVCPASARTLEVQATMLHTKHHSYNGKNTQDLMAGLRSATTELTTWFATHADGGVGEWASVVQSQTRALRDARSRMVRVECAIDEHLPSCLCVSLKKPAAVTAATAVAADDASQPELDFGWEAVNATTTASAGAGSGIDAGAEDEELEKLFVLRATGKKLIHALETQLAELKSVGELCKR